MSSILLDLLRKKPLAPNRMSTDHTPKLVTLPCGGVISTVFLYNTVAINAANASVYVQKSTIDAANLAANPATPSKYVFKTDRERMQYIIGRQGTAPKCTGY